VLKRVVVVISLAASEQVCGSSSVVHVDDGTLYGQCVYCLGASVHGGEHGVEGDVLDEPWDTAAVMEDLCDGLGLEEGLSSGAGGLDVSVEEGLYLAFVERAEAQSDADALPQSVVDGLGEPFTEDGLSDEDESKGAALVKVVSGEETEVLKGGIWE
jgi:hypothetical protein